MSAPRHMLVLLILVQFAFQDCWTSVIGVQAFVQPSLITQRVASRRVWSQPQLLAVPIEHENHEENRNDNLESDQKQSRRRRLPWLRHCVAAGMVSAFAHNGPPRTTTVVSSRALSDAGKRAATAALVVALTLPFVEPAWAATYTGSSNEVLASLAVLNTEMKSLDTKIDNKFDSVNNKFDSVINKIDTAKNKAWYGPALTAAFGIAASSWVSLESSKRSNLAVDSGKEQAKLGKGCNK
jgi:hypothetical protein